MVIGKDMVSDCPLKVCGVKSVLLVGGNPSGVLTDWHMTRTSGWLGTRVDPWVEAVVAVTEFFKLEFVFSVQYISGTWNYSPFKCQYSAQWIWMCITCIAHTDGGLLMVAPHLVE